MLSRTAALLALAAVAASSAATVDARADLSSWFQPLESPLPGAATPKLRPFGMQSGPALVLFQSIRVTRPSDIPPPKPAKGVALLFDW